MSGARRILTGVLIVLFSIALVAGTIGTWARRTLLRTDRFVDAVGPVPENDDVAAALARFLTNELFAVVNVQDQLEELLPRDLEFLAVPVTDGVQEFFRERVEVFLLTTRFDDLWRQAARVAHEKTVKVLRGEGGAVTNADGEVEVDLLPIVNEVLVRIQEAAPDIVGDVELPDLTDRRARQRLRAELEDALGVELPADLGRFTVFDSDRLSEAQDAVEFADRFVIALVVIALGLGAGSLLLSVDRRRTVLQLGLSSAIGIFVVFTVLRRVVSDLVDYVADEVNRDAVRAAARIVSQGLRDQALYTLAAALAVAVAAYVAGPGRGALAIRRLARTREARVHEGSTAVPQLAVAGWVRANADVLRVGGMAVAVGLLLIVDVTWLGFFTIAVLLAAYEVGVTMLARRADVSDSVRV